MKPYKLFTATIPTALALAFLSVPATMSAAVFTLGNVSGTPGSEVTIAITTSEFVRSDWISTDFTITWDTGVLAYKNYSAPLFTTGSQDFNPGAGAFSWGSATPATVPNGSTIFQATFTINPAAPIGSYAITFDENWPLQVGFPGPASVVPTGVDGSIEAVPEPVNCALAFFACLAMGTSGAKLLMRRNRKSY